MNLHRFAREIGPISTGLPPLESLSPAFRLLLACARHPLTAKDLAHLRACLALNIDWTDFLDLVERHRVHPQVLASLNIVASSSLPVFVREALTERVRHQTRHTFGMLKDLVTLVPALEAAGIPVFVLKGPPLSQLLFQDLAFRYSKDLDLLIPPSHFAQALALLEGMGCVRTMPKGPMSARQFRRVCAVSNHLVLETASGTMLELHLHADHEFGLPEFLYDVMRVPAYVSLGNVPIPMPPMDSLLTYLCIHGCRHHWSRLKWLCDIQVLLTHSGDMDWEIWIQNVRSLRLERIVAETLAMVTHFLEAPLPRPLVDFVCEIHMPRRFLGITLREFITRGEVSANGTTSYLQLLRTQWHRWQGRSGIGLMGNFVREIMIGVDAIMVVDLPVIFAPIYAPLRLYLWMRLRRQRFLERKASGCLFKQ